MHILSGHILPVALQSLLIGLRADSGKYSADTACKLILHVITAGVPTGNTLPCGRPHIRHTALCPSALKRSVRGGVHFLNHLSGGDTAGLFVRFLPCRMAGLFTL